MSGELTGIPPSHMVAKKSSRPVNATLRSDSNILHHEDSSPKRSAKKKGGKKRKLHGHATHKKLNLASENTCEKNTSPAEVLQANLLADKLSENTFSARLLVKDAHLSKVDAENDYLGHGTLLNLSTLRTDEMDGSECTYSSNDATGASCHRVTYLNNGSNTIHASKFSGSTFAEHGLGEESNIYQKLFCAHVFNRGSTDTLFRRWNNGNNGNFSVNLKASSSTGLNDMRMGCHFIGSHPNATHAEDTNDYCSSTSCCSRDATDSSSHTERVMYGSEVCSSKTSLQFNSRRSFRKSRKTLSCTDLTMSNRVGIANRNKNGGKDSSAVWQKVEKGDMSVTRGGHTDDSPTQDKSSLEDTSKDMQQGTTRHRTKCKQNQKGCKQEVPNFEMESTKEEGGAFNSFQTSSKSIYKNQVSFLHQQKSYYAPKNGIPKVPKDYSQQEDLPQLQLVQVKNTGHTSTLSSCSADEAILTRVGRNCKAEGKESLQSGTEKGALSYGNFVPDLIPQAASWISRNWYSNPCAAEREEARCAKSALENNPQGCCKLYLPSGHLSQKRVSVGKKEVPIMIHLDVLETSVVEGSVPANDVSDSVGRASTAAEDLKLASELTSESKSYEHNDLKWPTYKGTETSYNKIIEAVSDVYIAWQRVEDVQLRIGRPLADFEQFIYSASPILHCSPCPTAPKSYLHQTSDITLSNVWRWYEEPGCYGLEVKAIDFHRSKDFWNNQCQSNTYFVPYLSAIQLFRQSKRLSGGSMYKEAEDMTCETSPCLNPPPIFAKLMPQQSKPRNRPSTLHAECDLQSSSVELIFEYFESEQPYLRHQLFDKVNELIAGVKPQNCHILGDPKNLELSLHDLHPTSWYCVAWYPIYRIPGGKFQAAFLTYHSLGHRSSSADQAGQAPVAFPVIGLQSYNDKAEWWFQMSKSDSQDVESSAGLRAGEASQVLKERLRTLDEAAAIMSRAEVLKNSQLSRNRHPDYEFFLSRS